MRILFLSSEAHPVIKTGGLGDVASALPSALKNKGEDVKIMLPAYPSVLEKVPWIDEGKDIGKLLGIAPARLRNSEMPDTGVPLILVDCPLFFQRGGDPYLAPNGEDWQDNYLRFAALAKAGAMVAEMPDLMGWHPELIHAHDWQCGLLPAYLPRDRNLRPATVFTIHNIQFQGIFGKEILPSIQIPEDLFCDRGVEFYGKVSFIKAAVAMSDAVTTVSPTYMEEVKKDAMSGWGLDGLLRARSENFHGILNGVDYSKWNPREDNSIPHNYDSGCLHIKPENKIALQAEAGLEQNKDVPLIGIVSRLAEQKGLDLVLPVIQNVVLSGGQIVLLGSGDPGLEKEYLHAAASFPGKVAVRIGYDEGYSHRIQAGADFFLVPSRREPCGLTQMYALSYGTLPIVRRTGGLADTVVDMESEHNDNMQGTGFVFNEATSADLMATIERAFNFYRDKKSFEWAQWRGMQCNFSWENSANSYLELYYRHRR